MIRIGLLSSTTISPFAKAFLDPILKDPNLSVDFVLVDARPKLSFKQKLKKNWRRGRGGYMLIMALKKFQKSEAPGIPVQEFCSAHGIKSVVSAEPYSNEVLQELREARLDILILVGGFGIVKKSILEVPRLGVLSYHHGNMRRYRGMPPVFWEMYNGEDEVGATVQLLSTGLDKGLPVEEISVGIDRKDRLADVKSRLFSQSEPMMYKAVQKVSSNDFIPEEITEFGALYTLPNLRQWIIFHLRSLLR